ncbi:hypothetical protein GCM10022252_04940 [Streptosporangium oxazolinicum]|uniref:Site-specific DNA-methyltransferase (adenine-specific) n=1 Tax=Streptosporangium oxazolinicum TaxID=909287 RepID=A0ABP8ABN1_9ACTN
MRRQEETTDRFVSRAELATLAGVRRPTITTWAKRHADFPQPISLGDGEFFTLADALRWLDGRVIPEKERRPDEPTGFTYGGRVRRTVSVAAQVPAGETGPARDADASPTDGSIDSDSTEAALQRLLGPLATRFRDGANRQTDYLNLLLCLIFLRRCAPEAWSEIHKATTRPPAELRPAMIMRMVGEFTDQTLRTQRIPPGVRGMFERLRPPPGTDLAEVIGLCDRLGTAAFHTLLSHFAAAMKFESRDYFTPREVAYLMARLAVGDRGTDFSVYDPWLRGGETLHAAGVLLPGPVPSVRGASPNLETLRLAGMNLYLNGHTAELRLSNVTPWEERGEPPAQVSAVVTNPPFNMRAARPTGRRDDDWPFGPPPPHNDNYAWLQYAVESLAPGGRAVVLMPHQAGVSFDEREHAIRREMVRRGTVEAVISLPSRLFPTTNTAVTIWVLSPPTDAPGRILFVDATEMCTVTRKEPFVLPPLAADLISELYGRRHLLSGVEAERLPGDGFAISADMDTLCRTDYSLDPAEYIEDRLGVTSSPSDGAPGSEAELARLRVEVDRLDAQADRLRPVPRTGFSGILPKGWIQVPLDNLCSIQAGPSFSRLGMAERVEHGSVPIVMPRHLHRGSIIAGDADKATEKTAQRLARFHLRVDDILCVRSGAMGQRAIVGERQQGWLFGGNLHRLRLVEADVVDPRYLLTFLGLPSVMRWIHSRSKGTVIPFITTRDLGQLTVTIPPLDEQGEIESALNTLDEQVAIHEEFARAAATARTALAERLVEGAVILQ